jgi:hypothetical protein
LPVIKSHHSRFDVYVVPDWLGALCLVQEQNFKTNYEPGQFVWSFDGDRNNDDFGRKPKPRKRKGFSFRCTATEF